jgi:putative ABC transport system ATP-binding protein
MGGLLTCSVGEVTLLGERLDMMNARQRDQFRANHVGYVFQRFNLVPYLNAIENIELASTFAAGKQRSSVREEATELLQSLNVIHSDWSKPTSHLSMGQQQRVAIARALINTPEILIADEPTSSLDAENRDNFLRLLLGLVDEKNTTLVFVSHDLAIAQYFTRVQALSEFNKEHC